MIRKRILQYLEYKGISKYKFYKDNSVSNGFLDKEGSMRSDICEKISYQYEDINLIWLITGKGEMLLQDQPKLTGVTEPPPTSYQQPATNSLINVNELEKIIDTRINARIDELKKSL